MGVSVRKECCWVPRRETEYSNQGMENTMVFWYGGDQKAIIKKTNYNEVQEIGKGGLLRSSFRSFQGDRHCPGHGKRKRKGHALFFRPNIVSLVRLLETHDDQERDRKGVNGKVTNCRGIVDR